MIDLVSGVMILDNQDLWSKFLSLLQQKINPITFNTWFKPLKLHEIDTLKNKIVIQVPMAVHKKVLETSWYQLLEDALTELTNVTYEISFVLEDETVDNLEIINNRTLEVKKDNNTEFITNLKKEFTFDNYVTGDTNKFAKTAAIAVAQQPGKIYNPLFIYGKSGLGKTHLMHAIGNYIVENSNLRVLYTTSENFKDDYTSIASTNGAESSFERADYFKNKYRDVDVLLIDDIQFLVGAEKTQQGFFHTFNELHSHNKQIIITSDRSPEDLKLLEERLLTRFRWGLTANIYPPDFELRCKILKDKMTGHEVAKMVPNEVIEYIATNCENDVRHLEGAITRLYAYAAMMGPKEINLEFAVDALKDYIGKSIYITNDIQKIQKAVADYYHITIEDLKSKKRTSNINYPRQIAMYLCRMTTSETIIKIGLEFGNRDHSTVLHSYDKINNEIQNDENNIRQVIEDIKNKIVN